MNILLKDGERIITTPTDDVELEKMQFADMVEDKLGREARMALLDLYYHIDDPLGEDWEGIADEYHSVLNDTMLELESVIEDFDFLLSDNRLSRDKLRRCVSGLRHIYDNIYRNM